MITLNSPSVHDIIAETEVIPMMVSTKGRYALRVMIDLAEHNNGEFIPLKDIAERQELSLKYLESIVSVLSKAHFVTGQHGKGGGYKLSREPDDYSVSSILKLTEGTLAPVVCLGKSDYLCNRAGECKTLPMWKKLDQLIENYLSAVTIRDLANHTDDGDIKSDD